MRRLALGLCAVLLLLGGRVEAHDTWFAPAHAAGEAEAPGLRLELGTGTRFPLREFPQSAASVARMGCAGPGGQAVPLRIESEAPKWLSMVADGTAGSVQACWAELHPVDIELAPGIVEIYLRDIHAPAPVRQAWSELQRRGVRWHETYRKSARIQFGDSRAGREPAGLPLEIVVEGEQPVRAGQPVPVRVLRDGKPLASFPIEFVSERSPVGIWRQTDDAGRASLALPLPGRWLVRGTQLRPAGDRWESDFVTLAITALPR